jgi:excisionase family DNA binding protein
MTEVATILDAESLLTSAEVAKLLQVDATSIINWSKKGYLQYYRTPGGHRRIRAADVVAFLKQRGMPIPPVLTGIDEKRLLVVEQDGKEIKNVRKVLEGYTTTLKQVYTQSIVQALLDMGTFRPHLLLLDMNITGMDPFEIVDQLKKKPETAGVEVLLMAEQPNKDMERRASEVGALGVLQKPVSAGPVLNQLGLVERA